MDLSRVLTVDLAAEETAPARLRHDQWTVGRELTVSQSGAPEMIVAGGSRVVLQSGARLVIPVEFDQSVRWPAGVLSTTIHVSLSCESACSVVPHSNVFRFEVRQTLQQSDRIERHYRRAVTGVLGKDVDAASQALRDLDAESPGTVMALYLHGQLAEREGNRGEALRVLRQAEATLMTGSVANGQRQMSQTRRDDLLSTLRAMIERLAHAK